MDSDSPLPIVYLPGALGRTSFWRPIADRLWRSGAPIVLGYPGFGDLPADPSMRRPSDFYRELMTILPPRFNLVAQSMGNVFALQMAIEQPDRVGKLVLCALTGGIDVVGLGGVQWREDFLADRSDLPRWFADDSSDFQDSLSSIVSPTLILCGDADPLSPVAIGTFLRDRLPQSTLVVISGGGHSMAYDEPDRLAPIIESFFA